MANVGDAETGPVLLTDVDAQIFLRERGVRAGREHLLLGLHSQGEGRLRQAVIERLLRLGAQDSGRGKRSHGDDA